MTFIIKRQSKNMKGPAEKSGQVDRSKEKIKTKGLRSGRMFGEVSIIFSHHTATVKAKRFCLSAYLAIYDDELRLNLNSSLKGISYFSQLTIEIIVPISMNITLTLLTKTAF